MFPAVTEQKQLLARIRTSGAQTDRERRLERRMARTTAARKPPDLNGYCILKVSVPPGTDLKRVAALYAADPNSLNLEWLAFSIEKEDIFDYSVVYSKMGPVQGDRLEKFVQTKAKVKNLEQMKIPFFPVATDLNTGQTWVFEKGSVARAVRASSSIPGIFQPVEINGRTYVDGGVTDNLPVDIARAKGADIIIAVNIQKKIDNPQINSLIDVILQSINIMGRELVLYKCRQYDS
jgi:NTE family protein